ncbi:MAG: sigma-70 family RNA polymerase sigma factor [Clostridia bacterium]|nr:sigma-70 family RNA polymerase sigma factor [Clostridia bacterium]
MYSTAGNEYIEEIIRKYSSSMLKTAFSLLKSTDDAEDAVQEAFIKLLTKAPEFENDEHRKAWLLRVTVNISKNMLKSAKRKNLPLTEEIPYMEKSDEVLPYVLSLDEKYRVVIHLYYYENYSIKEIAEILSLPAATVGTRLSRARKMLEKSLKEDFGDEV